jgi:hypothetical protein
MRLYRESNMKNKKPLLFRAVPIAYPDHLLFVSCFTAPENAAAGDSEYCSPSTATPSSVAPPQASGRRAHRDAVKYGSSHRETRSDTDAYCNRTTSKPLPSPRTHLSFLLRNKSRSDAQLPKPRICGRNTSTNHFSR